MRSLVAADYVHHTPFGDWTFAQFVAGLEWVESQISEDWDVFFPAG